MNSMSKVESVYLLLMLEQQPLITNDAEWRMIVDRITWQQKERSWKQMEHSSSHVTLWSCDCHVMSVMWYTGKMKCKTVYVGPTLAVLAQQRFAGVADLLNIYYNDTVWDWKPWLILPLGRSPEEVLYKLSQWMNDPKYHGSNSKWNLSAVMNFIVIKSRQRSVKLEQNNYHFWTIRILKPETFSKDFIPPK